MRQVCGDTSERASAAKFEYLSATEAASCFQPVPGAAHQRMQRGHQQDADQSYWPRPLVALAPRIPVIGSEVRVRTPRARGPVAGLRRRNPRAATRTARRRAGQVLEQATRVTMLGPSGNLPRVAVLSRTRHRICRERGVVLRRSSAVPVRDRTSRRDRPPENVPCGRIAAATPSRTDCW